MRMRKVFHMRKIDHYSGGVLHHWFNRPQKKCRRNLNVNNQNDHFVDKSWGVGSSHSKFSRSVPEISDFFFREFWPDEILLRTESWTPQFSTKLKEQSTVFDIDSFCSVSVRRLPFFTEIVMIVSNPTFICMLMCYFLTPWFSSRCITSAIANGLPLPDQAPDVDVVSHSLTSTWHGHDCLQSYLYILAVSCGARAIFTFKVLIKRTCYAPFPRVIAVLLVV